MKERFQLPEGRPHEVLLSLSEGLDAAGEELLGGAVELWQLVQKLGVERLVVAARHLQLVLNPPVLEALGSLLATVVVQQLVETLLDQLVRPGEHEEELAERVDHQSFCALLLLNGKRDETGMIGRWREATYVLSIRSVGDSSAGRVWFRLPSLCSLLKEDISC